MNSRSRWPLSRGRESRGREYVRGAAVRMFLNILERHLRSVVRRLNNTNAKVAFRRFLIIFIVGYATLQILNKASGIRSGEWEPVRRKLDNNILYKILN